MPHLSPSRRLSLAAGLAAAALLLGGCASSAAQDPAAKPAAGTGFPVTIDSKLGSATITSRPKRVVTVSWTNQDVAAALGVVPVDMPFASYGDNNKDGILPWTYDALKKLKGTDVPLHDETDGIPFEAIGDAQPDVILAAYSGLTQEDFDTLSKIAPVVGYPDKPWGTSWKETTLMDAKALGKEKEAKAKIASTEKLMAAEVAKYPKIAGKTFAYLSITSANPDAITYYTPNDARVQFVTELGLKNSPTVEKLSKGSSEFYGTISAENADTIDADIVILYADSDEALDAIAQNPLLGQIPAVKRGAVVPMIDTTFIMSTSAPSLLSIPWALDKYVPLIGKAAAKAD
ncbi:MAG TPA: iron-siderophore ABC transporter substrate-binding protein [Lacisediminihabitans sp.]|uniref:iron-siderophore ABC transporter substrate-binding protein n=1 Tax=Lacisediminihabitans sp. TaxID=2787631 RepID=UPI002ED925E1